MRWVEEWTKAQAWGCPAPQEISKKYKLQSLGMPARHPFFIGKNQVTFQYVIFLLLHALCVFLGASVVFSFQFFLVLFTAINGWTPTNIFWRSCLAFHLPRTLRFSLYSFPRVFSFSRTACSFRFLPWFVFISCYIFSSRCIFASGLYWFSSKELVIKSLNGVGKEKSFMQKSGTRRSLCRLRPRILHVVLDVFLIACLVVLL
jgi:hypothetical protein